MSLALQNRHYIQNITSKQRTRPFFKMQNRRNFSTRVGASKMEPVNPDNASILVCGGGGIALQVAKKLKDRGSWVWLMQRNESRKKIIEDMGVVYVRGDGLNNEDVEKVFDSMDDVEAVVSSIGGTVADPRADSEANINLINAALKKGIKKFVLITSIGCGDTSEALDPKFFQVIKPVLLEKNKAEALLQASADRMDYVIIRPGGLTSDPATNKGVLVRGSRLVSGMVTREDTAELSVRALFAPDLRGEALAALDETRMRNAGPDAEILRI